MLSFLFHLQEKMEEPFEITIFSLLAGPVFCGLPVLLIGLFYWFLIKPVQDRKDTFSEWVREQEELSKEQKQSVGNDSNHHE